MLETQARALITSFFDGYDNDRGEELWSEFDVAVRDLDLGDDGLILALSVAAELYTLIATFAEMRDETATDMWIDLMMHSMNRDPENDSQ